MKKILLTCASILLLGFFCSSTGGSENGLRSSLADDGNSRNGIAACQPAPEGMVCIPGGKSYIGPAAGDDKATAREGKLTEVTVSTFYIDKYEITNAQYNKCVKEQGCSRLRGARPANAAGEGQPVLGISWRNAHDYCKWVGKRLPTEAEWEKAARGGEKNTPYPWGDAAPTCEAANMKGCGKGPSAVSAGKVGHYGLVDMAGNAAEWVNDWATACREGCPKDACGAACTGTDPLGPCDGKFPCEKRRNKIIKGGAWNSDAADLRVSARAFVSYTDTKGGYSARCVSPSPFLTNPPGWMLTNPPPARSLPGKPTPEQLKILHEIDHDTLNKPFCDKPWTSPAHCRDPVSYIKGNEARQYLFGPYIKNLGGGYMGVSADKNYTFIAHARSEWAWIFDFDITIIRLHRVLKALIKAGPTRESFVAQWSSKNSKAAEAAIRKEWKDHPDLKMMISAYRGYRKQLESFYRSQMRPDPKYGDMGWLRNPEAYKYVHQMYMLDRIAIVPGDMLKDKSMRNIGAAAKKLGTRIRLYYPSNAEEFWKFSDNYKGNIAALPFDEASVVLRTIHEYPWHPKRKGYAGFWHYVVHGAYNYQERMRLKSLLYINDWKYLRIVPGPERDFSTIDLPSKIPDGLF